MHNKSPNFSMEDAIKIAGSPEGRKLLSLLQQANPELIRSAMAQAAGGNLDSAKKSLEPLMASEEIRKLMEHMGG